MPYTIGLQSAATAFVSAGFATQFTVAVITFLAIVLITSAFQQDGADTPTSLPGVPLLHIVPFFRRRYDFLNWAFHATGQSIFQFKLLRNTVIVVSGDDARQTFFTAKGLDLTEGFKILSGAIPMVRGVTADLQSRRIALIHKRLTAVQREAPLSALIPQLLEDSRRVMESWGSAGKFDPFENVYELTFQTTIRSISCDEIANDPALVSRLKRLYDTLDTGTTPATVLLPWLPTPAMLKKLWATKEIYDLVSGAIRRREEALKGLGDGEKPQDTLQMLLDSGDEKLIIVGFIMGLLIAGARATGTTASWLITFLASHPEWAKKARAEVEELLATHGRLSAPISSPSPSRRFSTHTSLHSDSPSSFPLASSSFSSHQRRDSQTSLSHKRKRCNSGSGSDVDSDQHSSSCPKSQNPSSIRQIAAAATVSDGDRVQAQDQTRLSTNAGTGTERFALRTKGTRGPKAKGVMEPVGFPDSDNDGFDGCGYECGYAVGLGVDSQHGIGVNGENKARVQGHGSICDHAQEWGGGELCQCLTSRVLGGPASLQIQTQGAKRKRRNAGARREQDLSAPAPSVPMMNGSPQVSSTIFSGSCDQPVQTPRSFSQSLAHIPLEIWESSTPTLDALIKETLRVAQPHVAMRRNLGPEIYINGKLVPTGAYVVYPFSDVHLDESVYEDAWKFDPSRWTDEGEGDGRDKTGVKGRKDVPMGYVGWGVGKTTCLGTRLAKVELKLILAMFALGFDIDVVDKKGESAEELPVPNWNDILLCRPPKGSFYLRYAKKDGVLL